MQITEIDMRLAGIISQQFEWTDKQFALVISATQLTVAFLEGKGTEWRLALSPLRQELNRLEDFARARKLDR